MKQKNYDYEAYICNIIIYGCLTQLCASGVDEDIPLLLDCIGKTLIKMSMENKPIEYYMKHFENADKEVKKNENT